MSGMYNKLVAGGYENLESLVKDLKHIKDDSKKIADQAFKQGMILLGGASFIVGCVTTQKVMNGKIRDINSVIYTVVGDLLILGVAYILTRVGKEEIRNDTEKAWPSRIKSYKLRGSAFMELGFLKAYQAYHNKNQ